MSIRLEEGLTTQMQFGCGIAKAARHGMFTVGRNIAIKVAAMTMGPDWSFQSPALWFEAKKVFFWLTEPWLH